MVKDEFPTAPNMKNVPHLPILESKRTPVLSTENEISEILTSKEWLHLWPTQDQNMCSTSILHVREVVATGPYMASRISV